MDEYESGIGFLAGNGELFCSRECAARRGATTGSEVDQDEYDALVETEQIHEGGLCPGCGAEFVVSWRDREPG